MDNRDEAQIDELATAVRTTVMEVFGDLVNAGTALVSERSTSYGSDLDELEFAPEYEFEVNGTHGNPAGFVLSVWSNPDIQLAIGKHGATWEWSESLTWQLVRGDSDFLRSLLEAIRGGGVSERLAFGGDGQLVESIITIQNEPEPVVFEVTRGGRACRQEQVVYDAFT